MTCLLLFLLPLPFSLPYTLCNCLPQACAHCTQSVSQSFIHLKMKASSFSSLLLLLLLPPSLPFALSSIDKSPTNKVKRNSTDFISRKKERRIVIASIDGQSECECQHNNRCLCVRSFIFFLSKPHMSAANEVSTREIPWMNRKEKKRKKARTDKSQPCLIRKQRARWAVPKATTDSQRITEEEERQNRAVCSTHGYSLSSTEQNR